MTRINEKECVRMKKRYFVAEGYDEIQFKDFLVVDENCSNMKEEDLTSEHSRWIDCTDELSGMKEIGRKQYNTGHDTLYETKDGSKVLVYTSYRQGKGEVIAFLPDDIETVDEAREYIYQQEQDFFSI